jgi:ATPase family associated with various cellular activities (AAA)
MKKNTGKTKKIAQKKTAKKAARSTAPASLAPEREISAALKRAKRNQARKAMLAKLSLKQLGEMTLTNINDFHSVLDAVCSRSEFPLKLKLGARWYPLVKPTYYIDRGLFGHRLYIHFRFNTYDVSWERYRTLSEQGFRDPQGNPTIKKFEEVLAEVEAAITLPEDLAELQTLLLQGEAIKDRVGTLLEVHGSALVPNPSYFGPRLIEVPFGSANSPRSVIVEPEIELIDQATNDYYFPFIRVFSLDMKSYVLVDVRDVKEHVYQTGAIDKLVLPPELKSIVSSVFCAQNVFGDLFSGRHGGMVILANGKAGIGKTLSAEVYAEETKRPLYVLEMGELGVDLDRVEKALQMIFARAARWNTVLLFDEADIFLAKRTESDLERNAIVGVFLRLLDQYKGFLFLTTNRADAMDHAFVSRITLRLDYPDLSVETKANIWQLMLQSAGIELDGDVMQLAAHNINGRQIRNVVRLLKATSNASKMNVEHIEQYMRYSPTIQ